MTTQTQNQTDKEAENQTDKETKNVDADKKETKKTGLQFVPVNKYLAGSKEFKDLSVYDGSCWCWGCQYDSAKKQNYFFKADEVKKFHLREPVKGIEGLPISEDMLATATDTKETGDTLYFRRGKHLEKACVKPFQWCCAWFCSRYKTKKDENGEDITFGDDAVVAMYLTKDGDFEKEKKKKERKKKYEALQAITEAMAPFVFKDSGSKEKKFLLPFEVLEQLSKEIKQVQDIIEEGRTEKQKGKPIPWVEIVNNADHNDHKTLVEFAQKVVEGDPDVVENSNGAAPLIIVFGVLLLLLALLVFLKKTGKLSSMRILKQTGPRSQVSSEDSSEAVGYLACTLFSLLAALTMGFLRRSSMRTKIASHVIDIEMERPFANEV